MATYIVDGKREAQMNWKAWMALVLIAMTGGFYLGSKHSGSVEAAKAAAAEKKVQQIAVQVQAEVAAKTQLAQQVATTQTQADQSDAKVKLLTAKLKSAQAKDTGSLTPGPVIPALTPSSLPEPEPVDTIKDDLIAAQAQDITNYKAVNLNLTLEIATDNAIIANQQKELDLKDIEVSAQVAANKSTHVKGIFQGGGTVAIVWGVARLLGHF